MGNSKKRERLGRRITNGASCDIARQWQWQRIVRHICNVAGLKISKRSFSFNRNQVSQKATSRRKRFRLEPSPSPSGRERYMCHLYVNTYTHTHTHAHCYLDSPCKSTKTAPNLARHHPVRIWTYYGVYYSLLELKFNWNKLCIYCRKSLTKWRICRLPCSLF